MLTVKYPFRAQVDSSNGIKNKTKIIKKTQHKSQTDATASKTTRN